MCINSAYADEATEARVAKLQEMLEQQQWQMKAMAEELAALQQGRIKDKGKSEGKPVQAAFKDGLVFEDGSGDWKLQLNGRIQADYRGFVPTEWKNDGFFIRRARLGGTFTFLKDFSVRVEGEYGNVSDGSKATTAMTYGYMDFARWKEARFRAGQFKPFFGLERTYSTNFLDFTELSLATNNGAIFTSTYDRGVMVFGDPMPWLNYNFYVVNGSGQNNDDVNDTKDYGGRINANFAKLADIKNAVIHLGVSASDGNIGFSTATGSTLTQATEANGATFFSVSGLGGTKKADRSRWGLESSLAYGPIKLSGEYIYANFDGVTNTGTATSPVSLPVSMQNKAFNNDIKAWYVDLNWLVTGENWADTYKNGVYGRVRPKNNMNLQNGWGALELGLRYSSFDASDFKNLLTTTAANGSATNFTTGAEAWTLGAKWIFNPNARLVMNYVHTDFDTPILVNSKRSGSEDAVHVRAQYDF
ncbi:MAG: porin [Methylophilaceae bacterium]|nr:porin [Methylophilaceae bacterium]